MPMINFASYPRRSENTVYACAWLIVILIYLLDTMEARAGINATLLDWAALRHMAARLLPFAALFVLTNYVLVPRFLLHNRLGTYLLLASLLMVGVEVAAFFEFKTHEAPAPPHCPHQETPFRVPFLVDLSYAVLTVGFNTAVALLFQQREYQLDRASMLKATAESQLDYLRAQINPHFYLNMLNSIHGMIEINPTKAQEMLIDMSKLMRHTLYDSAHPRVALQREIEFLKNYIRLMADRYPAGKVRVRTSFPPPERTARIEIPPLLFMVFIENAFKHGVGASKEAFVEVAMRIAGESLRFTCTNSIAAEAERPELSKGLGLANVRKRLNIKYGSSATLITRRSDDAFYVELTIPLHETTHSGD